MFINLTKHPITELTSGFVIQPSGIIARITTATVLQRTIDSIPIVTSECTAITGIPEPVEGTVYIVPNLVADNLVHYPEYASRKDIVSPGKVKRQDNQPTGKVIGCEMFRGLSSAYTTR